MRANIAANVNQHAFGSLLPGRSYQTTTYKYGFNGKENDNEVKGTGNQQDYGFRIYDPRLGKFLSVDPDNKRYVEDSPYSFSGNNPIRFIDLVGLSKGDPLAKKATGSNSIMIVLVDASNINKVSQEFANEVSGKWDFIYVTDLTDANNFIKSNYPSDHQFENIFIRSHSGQDDERKGGIEVTGGEIIKKEKTINTKGELLKSELSPENYKFSEKGLITSNIINKPGSKWVQEQGTILIEIIDRVSPNGKVAFSACGLAFHPDFAQALASKTQSKDFSIFLSYNHVQPHSFRVNESQLKIEGSIKTNTGLSGSMERKDGWLRIDISRNRIIGKANTNSDLLLNKDSGKIEERKHSKENE